MQQFIFNLNEPNSYNTEDYIVSDTNKAIIKYLEAWPNWGNNLYSKILFIKGSKNSGKTHLAHIWKNKAQATFISEADFYKYLPVDLINGNNCHIIDNFENFLIKETNLLHLINLIIEQNKYLLITSSINLSDIKLADLKSRLLAFPKIEIEEIDDELFKLICFKYFSDKHLRVNDKVVNYMATRVDRSFDNVKRIINLIDKKALIEKRNVTINLIREILEHIDK